MAPRSARVPVEVSAGRREASYLEMIVDISMRLVTSQIQFNRFNLKFVTFKLYNKECIHVFSSCLPPMKDGSLESSHDITEHRIFIMARQVASAVVG